MNKWKTRTLIIVVLIVIIAGVALDQLLKAHFENLQNNGELPRYFFGTVGFVWAENPGGAWTIFGNFEHKNVLFFILTLLGIPLFLALLFIGRKKSVVGILGYSAAVAGTIGNAIDRLIRGGEFFSGKVRDFISIGDFPVFNIADMLLVGGVIFIILAILFFDDDSFFALAKKEKENKKNEDKTGN